MMTVVYKNLSFIMLTMAAMSLLIFGILQNASATNSEIRMLTDLNPPVDVVGGEIAAAAPADGHADYRERGNSMRLNVEVEDVSPNSTFTIEISGNTLGTITTNSFGTAELELNTNDGQVVPKILRGDLVQIFQGTELVLSGNFDDDAAVDDDGNGNGDSNIESGGSSGQAPITPNQNSVIQASNSSANLFTVPSSNTTLQDVPPVTAINSSNNNNVSNAVLGSLFLTGEDKLTSFNPINETYTEVSYVGNRTIMPPDGTTTAATINATETGNLTLKLQPNGITIVEGQSLLVIEGGGNNTGGAEQQENATAVLVDLNGVRPDDPRSSTGVVFFSTNSTGQLAFLDNMIAIYQVKASPEGTAIRMWEWKGADLPFESGGAADGIDGSEPQ
jgi:hypothetical protein